MARRIGNQPGNPQADLNAAAREASAFQLRAEGRSYEEIAALLGYYKADGDPNRSAAYKAYRRCLARIPKETIEEMRAVIFEQQRVAYVGLLPLIRRGDTFAVDAMTRMHDRLAKLFGLDTPAGDVSAMGPFTKRITLEDGPLLLEAPAVEAERAQEEAVA